MNRRTSSVPRISAVDRSGVRLLAAMLAVAAARRATSTCMGVAVGALAILLLLGTGEASAATEIRKIETSRTIEIKYNPSTDSECAVAGFDRWQPLPNETGAPIKVYWNHAGSQYSEYISAPYDDNFEGAGAAFPPPPGYHQWKIASGGSYNFGGGKADCSDQPQNIEDRWPPPDFVEIEVGGDPGKLSGWVTNRDGEGEAGVPVSIAGTSESRQVSTDAEGHYSAEVPVGTYTVAPHPDDGRYASKAGANCAAGAVSCTVEMTAEGNPVASFETALAVDSVAFEQGDPRTGALGAVPATGTYDGNAVQVEATISNVGSAPLTTGVSFGRAASASAESTTPLAAAGSPPADVTVPAGGTATISFPWDTQGQAWTDASRPDTGHIIRAATELTSSRAQESIAVRPKPLILVHGWNATSSTWEKYPELIGATNPDWHGYAVGDGQAPGVMNTTPFRQAKTGIGNTVFENAHEEARYIEGVRAKTGAWHVDIVAHSMGGLISRQYVASFMPADPPDGKPVVGHLVMLGTPNEGSVCADLLAATEGTRVTIPTQQLTTTFARAFNSTVTDRHGVPFSILAGNVHEKTCGQGPDGDLVVPVPSALWKIKDRTVVPGLVHTEMGSSQLAFHDWVLPHVAVGPNGGSLSGVLGRASTVPFRAASSRTGGAASRFALLREDARHRRGRGKHGSQHKGKGKQAKCVAASGAIAGLTATGSFGTGAKGTTRSFRVAAAKSMVLSVFAPEVALRLRDPHGRVIAPAGGTRSARGELFQTFVVAHPRPGRWQLRARGTGGEPRIAAYALRERGTAEKLSARLGVARRSLRAVTATFTRHGHGVRRARVRAVVKLPSGKIRRLALRAVPGHPGRYRSGRRLPLGGGPMPLVALIHAARGPLALTTLVNRATSCRS